jgi:uncharacterized protein YkwD
LRKLAPSATALPTNAVAHLAALARRSNLMRFAIGMALATTVGVGVFVANDAPATIATPPSVPVPLTSAAFRTAVTTGLGLDAPMSIEFSTPMNEASVAAAVRVEPRAPVELAWDPTGRRLTITPATAWSPDTLHTLVVEAGALADTGRPLGRPMRAAFLTRAATEGRIEATELVGKRITVDTGFAFSFARPVKVDSVLDALETVPPLVGTIEATGGLAAGTAFTFTPASPLQADTRYRLTLSGVRTADGEILDEVSASLKTARAPTVVRLWPKAKTSDVARGATVSVRFSESMNVKSTRDAFRVQVNGKTVGGRIRFAEDNTVLHFDPSSRFPYEAKVVASIGSAARSAVGTPIADGARASFTVAEKPAPPPVRVASAPRTSSGGTISGGSTGGGGSWASVERYYLGLMNCTRTGGWVTSSGSCSSPGGRSVAALKLDSGISSRVARPYAKLLATRGLCSHFANGGPDDRLRRAGYSSYRWAENIGCRSGDAKKAVLATHLFFQSEKSYNGGHYVNMMSSKYDRVGIGVWVSGGRGRLVVDFYHP